MAVRMLQLTLRGFALVLAAALTLIALPLVHAQERYPSRPIRMIVPFTAGTCIDILARTIPAMPTPPTKPPKPARRRRATPAPLSTW